MTVTALFPTYVFDYNFVDEGLVTLEYLAELRDEMDKMRKNDPAGRQVSNAYTGWQSNDSCERNSKFNRLFRCINRMVQRDLLPFFGISPTTVQLPMGNCWANINDPGAWNRPHLHNGCWMSGAFYVHADGDEGDIVFIDQHSKVVADFPSGRRSNPSMNISPRTGSLLLFPSGLLHMVEPNGTDKDRYSVAFNLETVRLSAPHHGGFSYIDPNIQKDPRGDEITFQLDMFGNPVYQNIEVECPDLSEGEGSI